MRYKTYLQNFLSEVKMILRGPEGIPQKYFSFLIYMHASLLHHICNVGLLEVYKVGQS